MNYIYWNDPNEFVDRLRWRLDSQVAGHLSHTNEIILIVEDLRELWTISFLKYLRWGALSGRTCRECFQGFKSGDFDVEDRHDGRKMKIFPHFELKALLAEDSCQMHEELAESLGVTKKAISKRPKAMGMFQKQGNWVPWQLLQRQNRKGFLHRIVTHDEKWVHYDNSKCRRS